LACGLTNGTGCVCVLVITGALGRELFRGPETVSLDAVGPPPLSSFTLPYFLPNADLAVFEIWRRNGATKKLPVVLLCGSRSSAVSAISSACRFPTLAVWIWNRNLVTKRHPTSCILSLRPERCSFVSASFGGRELGVVSGAGGLTCNSTIVLKLTDGRPYHGQLDKIHGSVAQVTPRVRHSRQVLVIGIVIQLQAKAVAWFLMHCEK